MWHVKNRSVRLGGAESLCVGIDLGREPVPDATTILRFCHPPEKRDLADQLGHGHGKLSLLEHGHDLLD
jgi:IS5 family transposase